MVRGGRSLKSDRSDSTEAVFWIKIQTPENAAIKTHDFFRTPMICLPVHVIPRWLSLHEGGYSTSLHPRASYSWELEPNHNKPPTGNLQQPEPEQLSSSRAAASTAPPHQQEFYESIHLPKPPTNSDNQLEERDLSSKSTP